MGGYFIPCCVLSKLTVIQSNLPCKLLVIGPRLTPCYLDNCIIVFIVNGICVFVCFTYLFHLLLFCFVLFTCIVTSFCHVWAWACVLCVYFVSFQSKKNRMNVCLYFNLFWVSVKLTERLWRSNLFESSLQSPDLVSLTPVHGPW